MTSIASRFVCGLAACAFMFATGQQAPAQHAPGQPQSQVIVGPSLKVLSTAHYQATASNVCSGTACVVTFAAPGANKRLTATRVTCLMQTTGSPGLNYARVELQNSNKSLVMAQYVTQVIRSASGAFTLNDSIDIAVAATQHLTVSMTLTANSADYAFCTISGTIATLG